MRGGRRALGARPATSNTMIGVPQIICPSCHATMPYTSAACPGCRRRMIGVGVSASLARRAPPADLGPTPFVNCRADGCDYFVTAAEERCPDCGTEKPAGEAGAMLISSAPKLVFALVFVAVFAPGLFLTLKQGGADSLVTDVAASFLLALFATFGAFIAWALWVLARGFLDRSGSPESQPFALRRGEQAVIGRLIEIKKRQQQLEAVLGRAGREEADVGERMRQLLRG